MSYFTATDGRNTREFDTPEQARAFAAIHAVYGYRAADPQGRVYYTPYPLLICDMLAAAKRITDYVRLSGFTYGDAPINPAMDHEAKKISCDRLVGWILYECGYTDQPRRQGLCVDGPILTDWCAAQGFIRVEDSLALKPGDIVFTRPKEDGNPRHTFMHAGYFGGEAFRYDCGSDARIQAVQPFLEPINDFMYAYRVKEA